MSRRANLAALLLFFASVARGEEVAVSTIPLRLEAIPSGVVLLFAPPKELASKIDIFRVYRTSREVDGTADLNPYSLGDLNYYHDWYKDYFSGSEAGRSFYYHVRGFDSAGSIVAVSQPAWARWKVNKPPPSGLVMTPTAYRRVPIYASPYSAASRLFPINVDLNAIYYIGKLYSHNELTELTNTRNSLFTRLGIWFLQLDAKVILEREGRYLPQIALGGEGTAMVRDTRQPTFQDPGIPAFSVKKENSRNFTSSFIALSKQVWWFRSTAGWINGDSASKVVYLTEFLPKESVSDKGVFYNMAFEPPGKFSVQWELIRPLDSKASPYLINLQIGRALRTNFDLAYLHYNQGYEVLGHLNFRFTLYPGAGKRTQ